MEADMAGSGARMLAMEDTLVGYTVMVVALEAMSQDSRTRNDEAIASKNMTNMMRPTHLPLVIEEKVEAKEPHH